MNIGNAFALAYGLFGQVEAALPQIKSGQYATLSAPVGVGGHAYNVSASWSPSTPSTGAVPQPATPEHVTWLENALQIEQLAVGLITQGVGADAAIATGAPFSLGLSLSLYGHRGSLSLSGSPAAPIG